MRLWCLSGWLVIPLFVAAWHYGPGQEWVALDDVGTLLVQADTQASAGDQAGAAELYDQALAKLPAKHFTESRRIRLERAKAQLSAHQLPTAHDDLNALVEEMKDDPKADSKLLADARSALASSQYYMTWLMRLEGEARDVWEPEIEAARQNYRLLAEQARDKNESAESQALREDLESSVRLAQLDLSELQGLPLPKQCQGCKSCSGKGSKFSNNKNKPPPKDVRSSSFGAVPDEGGS